MCSFCFPNIVVWVHTDHSEVVEYIIHHQRNSKRLQGSIMYILKCFIKYFSSAILHPYFTPWCKKYIYICSRYHPDMGVKLSKITYITTLDIIYIFFSLSSTKKNIYIISYMYIPPLSSSSSTSSSSSFS